MWCGRSKRRDYTFRSIVINMNVHTLWTMPSRLQTWYNAWPSQTPLWAVFIWVKQKSASCSTHSPGVSSSIQWPVTAKYVRIWCLPGIASETDFTTDNLALKWSSKRYDDDATDKEHIELFLQGFHLFLKCTNDFISCLLLRQKLGTLGHTSSNVCHLLKRRVIKCLKWLYCRWKSVQNQNICLITLPDSFRSTIWQKPAWRTHRNIVLVALLSVQVWNGHWHSFAKGFPQVPVHGGISWPLEALNQSY